MSKRRSPIWKIPRDELAEIVTKAQSLSEVLGAFGLTNKGGNHKTVKARLEHEGLGFSHIPLGRGSNKMRRRGGTPPVPLEEILVEHSSYSTNRLKKRLVEIGLLQYSCAECGQGAEWQGRSLVLVLDHINGISSDHRLENLRLLCPNCNSQTTTFCGRNGRQ